MLSSWVAHKGRVFDWTTSRMPGLELPWIFDGSVLVQDPDSMSTRRQGLMRPVSYVHIAISTRLRALSLLMRLAM